VLPRFILAGAAAFHWLGVRLFGISYREWISRVYERCVGRDWDPSDFANGKPEGLMSLAMCPEQWDLQHWVNFFQQLANDVSCGCGGRGKAM
jgi:hypothetical protein